MILLIHIYSSADDVQVAPIAAALELYNEIMVSVFHEPAPADVVEAAAPVQALDPVTTIVGVALFVTTYGLEAITPVFTGDKYVLPNS